MTLNKDGLEAAHAAYERYGQIGDLKSQRMSDGCLSAVITAYLASLPAPDGLAERLRLSASVLRNSDMPKFMAEELDEAATVIQTLQRERDAARKKAGKLHDYANMRDMQIVDLRGTLEELVDSLTPAEHAAGRDPAYGDVVRNLGQQIGFGALMSCASTEWRLWLEENGYPVGSEFVSGPCRSVLQSDLARARLLLKDGGE